MRQAGRGNLFALFVAGTVGAVWLAAAFAYYALTEMPVAALPAQFSIKTGSSLKSAAAQMAQEVRP